MSTTADVLHDRCRYLAFCAKCRMVKYVSPRTKKCKRCELYDHEDYCNQCDGSRCHPCKREKNNV